MPLILRAAIAWAAGTALGLGGALLDGKAGGGAMLLGVCGALVCLLRDRATGPAALALLAVAGARLGIDVRASDARCTREATKATTWLVVLQADAEPGAFARAVWARDGCGIPLALAVRSGTARSGSLVRVDRAEPSEGDRGLLLREARLTRLEGPGPLARWRNGVSDKLDRRFGRDAGIVKALLIADTRGLSHDLRARYADAGLVHILSISGLHVAIVGGALLLLFQALRLGSTAAGASAVIVTAVYVFAIGAPPPAVRSATLFAATTFARVIQRPVSPWGTFALAGAAPLVDPRTVLDLGWQLSVAGYAAIVVAGRVGARRLPEAWRGWRRALARELVAGVLTSAVTAPLVAWHFGRLSLVSPLSNIIAGPVVTLLQPTLFLAMVVPDGGPAAFVADAARPMLRSLDAVATGAASMPGAATVVAPTLITAALCGVAAFGVLVAGWTRHWARPAILAVAAVAVAAWTPSGRARAVQTAELHLLDVGQGDAIALRSPKGRWVVIDAGRAWSSGDAGRTTVIPHLRRHGGELALMVLTHPHADHIGGAASVVRALRPRELRDAAYVEGSRTYRELLATVRFAGTRWQRVRPGERIDIDGLVVDFLAPDSAWTVALDDPNEASTVIRATYGAVRLLLTGDAERREEAELVARAVDLRADVLKVGHHGSATSSTPDFLDAVRPRIALVSVGRDNVYGHPGPDVMRRLVDQGATVLRTDLLGTVILRTDGAGIEVDAGGHRWRLPSAH